MSQIDHHTICHILALAGEGALLAQFFNQCHGKPYRTVPCGILVGLSLYMSHGQEALWLAAKHAHRPAVEFLVMQSNIDVDSIRFIGNKAYTPLHVAALGGHVEIVEILLEAEAQVEALTEDMVTPLHLAVEAGHTQVVQMLINAGANKESLEGSHLTPLGLASYRGHTEITRMLLAAGANPEPEAYPPIILAALKGHVDIFRMLLAAGADPYAADEDGETSLSVAIEHGHPEIVWIMLLAAQ